MFKLIRRRLLKKNSGGFTLAEVIISCALLGILVLGIVMFVSPILKSVNSANANTKASNVAETIEYYISRSIRNAAYIAVLTDTNFSDIKTNVKASAVIKYLSEKAPTGSNYNLKCISIRYAMDEKSQTYKYFICNETVEPSGAIKDNPGPHVDTMVFDPCYFDGIYPSVSFKEVPKADDPDKSMPAVEIEIKIYDDYRMREDNSANDLIFSGTGYTSLKTIELAQKEDGLDFNIVDDKNCTTETATNVGEIPARLNEDVPNDDYANKETYIFYVERTLATATPAP